MVSHFNCTSQSSQKQDNMRKKYVEQKFKSSFKINFNNFFKLISLIYF